MLQKIILGFIACLLLSGSAILPLGDFSLMRDIPDMYGNYSKITTQDELGIIDFIGDYLLHGKDLFGHNAHDKQPTGNSGVQFQHQANPLNIAFFSGTKVALAIGREKICVHTYFIQQFLASGHRKGLLRPPLA